MARRLGSGYELEGLIGRGAMGQVWRAKVISDESPVAVKILRGELSDDASVVARFVRERDILLALDHPNLVRVRDLVAEGDELAIVMDLVEGPNLRALLRQSPSATLAPSLALDLACQVLSGLEAVHASGVIHRDVKPENVLVDTTGPIPTARLSDFGVAKMASGATLTRMTGPIGTPDYLAPELAQGDEATPAADVYAIGTVLYELLFGHTPFGGGLPLAVLDRHRHQPPPRPSGVPDELWAVLSSFLAKDPKDRPATAALARAQLEDLAPGVQGLVPFEALGASSPEGAETKGGNRLRPSKNPTQAAQSRAQIRARWPALASLKALGARQRAAIVALPAVVVLVVAAVVLARPDSSSASTPAAYAFVPVKLKSGLVLSRTWELRGKKGDALHGQVSLTNDTPAPVSDVYDETVPKAVAKSVDDIGFAPAFDEVIDRDPVVRYVIRDLAPNQAFSFSYDVDVPAKGNDLKRLLDWAKGKGDPDGATLSSLAISPEVVELPPGGRLPLQPGGQMSDGSKATPAVLDGLRWSTKDPAVVAVENGNLTAVGFGATEVVAQAGPFEAKVPVTVREGALAAPAPVAPAPVAVAPPAAPSGRSPRGSAGSPTAAERRPVAPTGAPLAGPSVGTPTRAEPTVAVYRLFHPGTEKHFYTTNANERGSLLSRGWVSEGTEFHAYSNGGDGRVPVYRVFSGAEHLLTTNRTERDSLVGGGWRDEGTAFYAYPGGGSGRLPVYRLFFGNGDHLFTPNGRERDALVARGWRSEGVGFYGVPPS